MVLPLQVTGSVPWLAEVIRRPYYVVSVFSHFLAADRLVYSLSGFLVVYSKI